MKDRHKLYALHAPELECTGKGKGRKPWEFGVKARIAATCETGLRGGSAARAHGEPIVGFLYIRHLKLNINPVESTYWHFGAIFALWLGLGDREIGRLLPRQHGVSVRE